MQWFRKGLPSGQEASTILKTQELSEVFQATTRRVVPGSTGLVKRHLNLVRRWGCLGMNMLMMWRMATPAELTPWAMGLSRPVCWV